MKQQHGGDLIAEVLHRHGATHLFALCGGHISPILTGAQARGLRIVDVRDEVNAVFAADAVARMTGGIGVAAVTAGPGVTNTITAVKNAQMAQSPIVIFGGATPTLLKGRGALQDIDALSIMRPITKWATSVKTVPALAPTVERACEVAMDGVPGPVFVEVPVDLLYPEEIVRGWYEKEAGFGKAKGIGAKALELYIRGHLYRQFRAPVLPEVSLPMKLPSLRNGGGLERAAEALKKAERPVIVVGSQALVGVKDPGRLARALGLLGAPVFLAGTARGLLGRTHELQLRHNRGAALKEADVVIICGFPFDFRLGYGRGISKKATLIAANLSSHELRKNRRPEIAVEMHAGEFLIALGDRISSAGDRWRGWLDGLREKEAARDKDIVGKAAASGELIDPLHFFLRVEEAMADDAVLVVDGGDFVATASYIVRPRAPLSWLDPGVFGTLGVGGGMALGASLVRPGREVWLIWGDGSSAYTLAEFDTYVRHGVAPIAVIGNDASWQQIAREQVEILGTTLGCDLRRTDYHKVAEGYGGVGLLLTDPARVDATLAEAKAIARAGRPVCINVHLRKSEFRKGSISM
ncbi:MAG: thiamine pyrophosphate-binding protein [Deltaproteobacteria bacterium]|nr:thiamine pyrophosphate-binding protein [Deltaproteobacteria bacterium]MCW5804360.1 thiamine pyrophosphate-binding protein [Deltaproteobacteria bacterium]